MTVNVSAAFTANERTRKLIDGTAVPEGMRFTAQALGPGELFYRQLKFAEFDVSELSVSSMTIGVTRGSNPWTALPVFTTREFFHTGILVRADSDIRTPEQLRGRRVGVLEYQQTAVVWIRGVLQNEFGVKDVDMEWFMERRPEKSHGGSTGFTPPEGVRLSYVPAESSLAEMLMAGELDAMLFYPEVLDSIDAKPAAARAALRTRTLFDDPAAEARRYFAKTGIFPINHAVVVRRSLAEANPWMPESVYAACVAANRDPALPYGMTANRKTLEALMQYLFEQRLAPRRVVLEEIFAASLMGS